MAYLRTWSLPIATAAVMFASTASSYPIGGITPDQRPEGAPVIVTVTKDAAWYRRALTGITPPYPASLSFLDDQGNWHTPFIHPGMSGRYDIRGWH